MNSPFENNNSVLATLNAFLRAEKHYVAASLITNSEYNIEKTGYDNWNGGTYIYTMYFLLHPKQYVVLLPEKENIQKQISEALRHVTENTHSDIFDVKISPSMIKTPESWEVEKPKMSEAQEKRASRRKFLALKDEIVAKFLVEHWEEIGMITDCSDIVNGHARLFRSMHFNDPDYPGNALSVLQGIVDRDSENINIITEYMEDKFPADGTNISSVPVEGKKIVFSPQVFQITDSTVDSRLVSVMMPFQAGFTSVYQAIQLGIENAGCRCERADNIWEHSVLVQDIFSLIMKSYIVVCDFSGKNPNVFYETGIAHTLGKHVIPLAQSADDVPFDLRHHRYIPYLNNTEGRSELTAKLTERVRYLSSLSTAHPWQ